MSCLRAGLPNNEGQNELITGKRYRANYKNDLKSNDPIGLHYFKWNGKSFVKNVKTYGPPGMGKDAGLFSLSLSSTTE